MEWSMCTEPDLDDRVRQSVFDKAGGADGIRIYQRYGNKGVLRCSLAFKGIERKERESLLPP